MMQTKSPEKAAKTLSEEFGIVAACQALNVSRATFYRRREAKPDAQPRPIPARTLSVDERKAVLDQLNRERFANQSPRQVYSKLLDEGSYLCSVRTVPNARREPMQPGTAKPADPSEIQEARVAGDRAQ